MNHSSEKSPGITLWFTGLSGSGKSTIANGLREKLKEKCYVLDGDIIRKGLNKDLGFSREDRRENIRRISEVAKLFNIAGFIVIVAFISPYSEDRKVASDLHSESNLEFKEVYINASLECCEKRDIKGLYFKARTGEIKLFTGLSDVYEAPEKPSITINTEELTVEQSVEVLMQSLIAKDEASIDISSVDEDDAIVLDDEELNLLQIIQQGWCPPELKCFMNEQDLLECINLRTFRGKFLQSMPIICPISLPDLNQVEQAINKKCGVKLINKYTGRVVAILEEPSIYSFRKEEISSKLFGTFSLNHPKIKKYFLQGNHLLTGNNIKFIEDLVFLDGLDQYRLSPEMIQKIKSKRKADCLYAFQLRNPLHNGHCMLLKEARNQLINEYGYSNPILLLHPCGGWTKDDDVPLSVRVQQYNALLEDKALDEEHSILAVWPSPMFYGGPAEVLWHFSSREFAGVDYMIVGRDPAGIKHPDKKDVDLYEPTHGQKIVNLAFDFGSLKIKAIPFKHIVYNIESEEMEFFNEDNQNKYLNISGSELRRLAKEGLCIPKNFMNVKGWEVLKKFYSSS